MHNDRILILDDEPLTGQTIRSIAEFAGFQARHTTDPETFFALLRDWDPGHIALDLIMPDMDGVQVMIRLAELQCRARIIVTSGVGTRVLDAAARSAAEHGLRIAGVLAKPFSPPRLRELLLHAPDDADVWAKARTTDPPPAREKGAPDTGDRQQPGITREQLQEALENDELFVVYQPKLHCRTGILTGFEALVRWQSPRLGLVHPDRFIPLAEQCGLIDRLTVRVLEKSLAWLQRLPGEVAADNNDQYLSQRMKVITLSLNISAASLNNLTLFDRMDALCEDWGIERERVILELTETSAMEDPVASLDILTRLRMRGYQLSIDDFGTGYSSMLQLARLPFSEIKVDKSFVMTAAESEESRTVIRSIIDLGHGLGLQATAEGIEDESTMDYLTSVGCDLAQGFYIARPMPERQLLEWLIARSRNDEESRLRVLHALNLLDTSDEERFDRVTRLARRLFGVRIALFSLVDAERQWFKSSQGLDVRETPRNVSFCSHAIDQDETLVVHDARQDARFSDNSLVTGPPRIAFYAGAPVRATNGSKLGTLCLIDSTPRAMSTDETRLLKHLAQLIETELANDSNTVTDTLTGLLNRQGFEQRASQLLQICNRFNLAADMLFFDIDHFRDYNRKYGEPAGDRCLASFSRTLQETFHHADLMTRFGSDEFVVLLVDRSPHEVEELQQQLHQRFSTSLEAPMDYSNGHAVLTAGAHHDLQRLLAQADQDMYADRARTNDRERGGGH